MCGGVQQHLFSASRCHLHAQSKRSLHPSPARAERACDCWVALFGCEVLSSALHSVRSTDRLAVPHRSLATASCVAAPILPSAGHSLPLVRVVDLAPASSLPVPWRQSRAWLRIVFAPSTASPQRRCGDKKGVEEGRSRRNRGVVGGECRAEVDRSRLGHQTCCHLREPLAAPAPDQATNDAGRFAPRRDSETSVPNKPTMDLDPANSARM